MLSFTRKTDYAMVALAGMAAEPECMMSAHELAARFHLPLPALRNILKRLARQGLVASTQGAAGGYRLARSAGDITIAEIVQAMQGPLRLAVCCGSGGGGGDGRDGGDGGDDIVVADGAGNVWRDDAVRRVTQCRLDPVCRIKSHVQLLQRRMLEFLKQITLAQLAGPAPDANLVVNTCSGSVEVRSADRRKPQPDPAAIETAYRNNNACAPSLFV